jgi:translation initiation factor IF-1
MSSKKGNANKSRTSANSTHQLIEADKKVGQQYAEVVKPLGNSTFLVRKLNGEEVLSGLKGSMKGKKFERVESGGTVLIQKDSSTTGKDKFFIIHLYTPKERKQLEKLGEFVCSTQVEENEDTFMFEGSDSVVQAKQSDIDLESLINDI